MEQQGSKNRSTLLIVALVLGGGFALFVLLLVLPAIFFLGDSETVEYRSDTVYGQGSREVSIPAGDGTDAPDFFDDLED